MFNLRYNLVMALFYPVEKDTGYSVASHSEPMCQGAHGIP
jgi:hypothetical protein